MHTDLKLKQSRQNNLVVTGLPDNEDFTDEQLFSELCSVEFGITPVVSQTKRLGKKYEGRLQPVLVVFQEADVAPFQPVSPCTPSQPSVVHEATDHLTFTVPQLEFYLQQATTVNC